MNFMALLKYIGPILSVILGLFASKDFSGIQSGVYAADAANYAQVSVTGLGSLLSLAAGIFATWRSTGRVPVADAVELVAIGTLGQVLAADGDLDGLALLAPLSKHIVARKGKPLPEMLNGLNLDTLTNEILKRLPIKS